MKAKKLNILMLTVLMLSAVLVACSGKKTQSDDEERAESYEPKKGDLRVILELDEASIIDLLAGHSQDSLFRAIMDVTKTETQNTGRAFTDVFTDVWYAQTGGRPLASIFSTQQLRDKITPVSTDEEVITTLNQEVTAAVENAEMVVRNRLEKYGINDYRLERIDNQPRLELVTPRPDDRDRLLRMLMATGNIEFWETYKAEEVVSYLSALMDDYLPGTAVTPYDDSTAVSERSSLQELTELDSLATTEQDTEAATLPKLMLISSGNAAIGWANKIDTVAINRMLQSDAARRILPSSLRLLWASKGETRSDVPGEWFYLYAINTNNSPIPQLDGSFITSVKAEYDQMSRPCLTMQMSTEGTRLWAYMTRKNAVENRAIAIVIDNEVMSAPVVHGEITGGSSQITGNFTAEEVKDMANVLNAGHLPVPLHIIAVGNAE